MREKYSNLELEDIKKARKTREAQRIEQMYKEQFRILDILPNGQLYCIDRLTGVPMILNDWRVKKQ